MQLKLTEESRGFLKGVKIGNYLLYSGERSGGGYPSIHISRKRKPEEVTEVRPENIPVDVCNIHLTSDELENLIKHLKARLAYTLVNKVEQL